LIIAPDKGGTSTWLANASVGFITVQVIKSKSLAAQPSIGKRTHPLGQSMRRRLADAGPTEFPQRLISSAPTDMSHGRFASA